MPTGIVKSFNPSKGFGYIVPDEGGNDVFVHISVVERAGLTNLNEGHRVEYELVTGRDGKLAAENLAVVADPRYRGGRPAISGTGSRCGPGFGRKTAGFRRFMGPG